MLRLLARLLKALNSEASPWQIAVAIAMGMIVGLTPLWRLHNLVLFFCVFFFRVNLSAFFVAFGFFSGIAYLADPVFLRIGENLLTSPALEPVWISLYSSGFWQLSRFNHTTTLGSLTIAVIMFPLLLIASKVPISTYRKYILTWMQKFKVVRWVKASRFYRYYEALTRPGVSYD